MSAASNAGTGGLASSVKSGRVARYRSDRRMAQSQPIFESLARHDEARAKSHKQFSADEMRAAMDEFLAK